MISSIVYIILCLICIYMSIISLQIIQIFLLSRLSNIHRNLSIWEILWIVGNFFFIIGLIIYFKLNF